MMESSQTYTSIEKPAEGLYKDKGSKFISLAYPVRDEEQIKTILGEVKKKYHDARHHCYAWALDNNREHFRINDDGEPPGTAGKPIYGQILANDLSFVLIVVVRYFGGTKLGVRGLINAYKAATQNALENANLVTKAIHHLFEIRFDYHSMNQVMKIIKDFNLIQIEHDFGLSCRLIFSVPVSLSTLVEENFRKISTLKIEFLSEG